MRIRSPFAFEATKKAGRGLSPDKPCLGCALDQQDETRRFLIKLLNEKKFYLAAFMTRQFRLRDYISIGDFNFFMNTIYLALQNGHLDATTN